MHAFCEDTRAIYATLVETVKRQQSSGVTDQYKSLDGGAPTGGDAMWWQNGNAPAGGDCETTAELWSHIPVQKS